MAITRQTGESVKRSLEAAVERVRRQLGGHVDKLHALDEKVDDLVTRRGAALVELARHYVPDVSHETIRDTFGEIRDDLLNILRRKQFRQSELQQLASATARKVEEIETELDRVTAELEQKVSQRERLQTLLSDRLHESEEFKQLSKRALEAENELERNEQRVADIRSEAERKLPSYENSRLFKYLYDAGYGTAKYKQRGLTRRIDRWVAKLIDFPTARRGYQFLRVTPELMASEVERRRNAFNGLMEQVESIEQRVADEIGLTAVMRQGQEIGAERDALVDQLAQTQDDLLKQQEDILQLDRPDSEFHIQAVARMRNFLSNMSEQRLQRESQATPEGQDDAIVAEVVWLNDQLEDVDRRSAALQQQRQHWDDHLLGLQSTLQRFRREEYDSPRSTFPAEFEVGRLISRFVDGEINADRLWSEIEQRQHFTPFSPLPQRPSPPSNPWGEAFPRDLFNSGASQVLFHVLSEVAGHALRESAYRSMQRRSTSAGRRSTRRSAPSRPPARPSRPRRGFTNGRGF